MREKNPIVAAGIGGRRSLAAPATSLEKVGALAGGFAGSSAGSCVSV